MRGRTSRIIINRRNQTIQFWKSWYPYKTEYPKNSRNQLRIEGCLGSAPLDWTVGYWQDSVIYTRRNVR